MITAKEASEQLANMSPTERLTALQGKVSESTQNALDVKVREMIAGYERKIDICLTAKVYRDADIDIAALLHGLGFEKVSVISNFPAYCDSFEETTTIVFSIP